jgi:hypothetical protein
MKDAAEPTNIPITNGESQGAVCPPTFKATINMDKNEIMSDIPRISSS